MSYGLRWAFALALSLHASLASADIQSQFHVVVPTRHASFRPDRSGSFKLEFRNVPFAEMKEAFLKCQTEGLLPPFERVPPVLTVYLPSKDILDIQKEEMAEEIRRQFNEVFPNADLKIEFRVPRTSLRVTYMHSRVARLLNRLKSEAQQPEERQFVSTLEKTNDDAFRDALRAFNVTAPVARRIKYSVATSRFFIVAATRSAQVLPALASGDPTAVAAGLALIVTDAATEFFTVAFTQRIQRFFMQSPIPTSQIPWRAKAAGMVNASLWNLLLFSVARPTLMQTMAHVADSNTPAPTLESASNVLGWSTVGAVFYTAFTKGYNTLRDKGWVTSSQIDLVLQISGIFDLATGILNSNPNWFPYRILTWGPQWTFYGLVAMLAKIAPTRADRIIAVDSSIVDWADIHDEHVADVSYHIGNEADFQQALAIMHTCDEIIARSNVPTAPPEEEEP